MKINHICLVAAILSMSLTLTACFGGKEAEAAAAAANSIRETVTTADPETAIEEIYATVEEHSVEKLDSQGLVDKLQIMPGQIADFFAYVSDPNYGLCDIIILQIGEETTEDEREELRKSLFNYQEARIAEFKNFNIFNSFLIAQNAVVFDQGEFVILLMLPDNESAQEIIDIYIPQ